MTRAERTGLTVLTLIALVIVLPVLVALCATPVPQQASAPAVAATAEPGWTLTEMPAPTLTAGLMGPAVPHPSSTLRPIATADPTVTAVVIVPTAIPSLTPVPPTMTEKPDVLPVIVPAPKLPPTVEGQHVVAPAQIPR